MKRISGVFILIVWFGQACTTAGPGLFNRKSPHEQYADKLKDAGLNQTALGILWFEAADVGLNAPLAVTLPYKETGYFAAEKPRAMGVKFHARRGEQITVTLEKKPASGFGLYVDLWQHQEDNRKPKLLQSSDTTGNVVEYEVKKEGDYLLRLQPELLGSGAYTLTIINGPSLAFPVSAEAKSNVASFWGAGRDNGARKHEGIDIFAPRRTPAVAAADGRITRVEETPIGGKVVWLRPFDKDYTLYYAHLDSQTTSPGQEVKVGQEVGLIGNTGNARTTPAHLHFGIYGFGGAVDPFPFVNREEKVPAKIIVSEENLGKPLRTTGSAKLYDSPDIKSATATSLAPQTLLLAESATAGFYKVLLPSGVQGFIQGSAVTTLSAVKKSKAKIQLPLYDAPDSLAPAKLMVQAGSQLDVLAGYNNFLYVSNGIEKGWVLRDLLQ